MARDKESDDEAYRQGVRDGQNAGSFDKLMHGQVKDLSTPANRRRTEIYNEGYEYGARHPRSEQRRARTKSSRRSAGAGAGSDTSGGEVVLGLIGLGVLIAVIELIFAIIKVLAVLAAVAILGASCYVLLTGSAQAKRNLMVAYAIAGFMAGGVYAIYRTKASRAAAALSRDLAEAAKRDAEQARVDSIAGAIEHDRVARSIAGIWSGDFDFDRAAYLRIAATESGIRAVLVAGFAQWVYQGELVDRRASEGPRTVLFLRLVRRTGDGFNDAQFQAPLAMFPTDSTISGWATYENDPGYFLIGAHLSLKRLRPADLPGLLFVERPEGKEVEYAEGDQWLYNQPGDPFSWPPRFELRDKPLKAFYRSLSITYHGTRYRHVVIRSPSGEEERRGWVRDE